MRRILIAAVPALALGAGVVSVRLPGAAAQTVPAPAESQPSAPTAAPSPAPLPAPLPPPAMAGWFGPGPDGPMPHGPGPMRHGEEMMRHGLHRPGWIGGPLLVRASDLKLSGADVQKIAEGFLLLHGNHAWKVAEVAENPDNTVSFALTTPEGSPIARFAMDRTTGQVRRLS